MLSIVIDFYQLTVVISYQSYSVIIYYHSSVVVITCYHLLLSLVVITCCVYCYLCYQFLSTVIPFTWHRLSHVITCYDLLPFAITWYQLLSLVNITRYPLLSSPVHLSSLVITCYCTTCYQLLSLVITCYHCYHVLFRTLLHYCKDDGCWQLAILLVDLARRSKTKLDLFCYDHLLVVRSFACQHSLQANTTPQPRRTLPYLTVPYYTVPYHNRQQHVTHAVTHLTTSHHDSPYYDRRYFQHAHFIPIVGVGKRGEY